MIPLNNGQYVIGFDDGYQLGKTANFIFNNGVHRQGYDLSSLSKTL